MSLICCRENCFLICHIEWLKEYINQARQLEICLSDCSKKFDLTSTRPTWLERTFEIVTPFVMDGEAKKIAGFIQNCNEATTELSLQKYFTEKYHLNFKESPSGTFISEDMCIVDTNLHAISKCSAFQNYFSYIPSIDDYAKNNMKAREASEKVTSISNHIFPVMDCSNNTKEYIVKDIDGEKYIIPPNCRFICDDAVNLTNYLLGTYYDYIVIDPPWRNKHIRRKKKARGISHSYTTLTVEELMTIPIKEILHTKSIVLIWITNSKRINEELLKSLSIWDLELVATWYWIKLTKSGKWVVHPDMCRSKGKLPYERILVAKRKRIEGVYDPQVVLQNVVLASIPSAIHSHKPPLNEVLARVFGLKKESKCLELFARNLIPHWTSVGFEAAKFQNITLFTFDGIS